MNNIRIQLLLCHGTSCMSNGAVRVREALEEALREANLEKEVEILLPVVWGYANWVPLW